MINHVEDRLWLEGQQADLDGIAQIAPEQNLDIADKIQMIRYRLKEIDQSILMGHDISSDKKEIKKLMDTLWAKMKS